jgi:hypothetical protein
MGARMHHPFVPLLVLLLIALYVDPIAARGWRFAAGLRRRAHA